MAKLKIGKTSGEARLLLSASLAHRSEFEIEVGDGSEMSLRQIELVERDRSEILRGLERARTEARRIAAMAPNDGLARQLSVATEAFASTASDAVKQKKWLNVSAAGVLDAIKALGLTAAPVSEAITKTIAMIQAIKSV
ncbi:hypothetical protein [Amaricoccus sp.]|uniref:hypothetical protein n=1 Tax=Amaricoccus sp. TaxID=1872485 RepID=UPI001B3DC09B|nr:hypothetical protein [Amaricoccus sp.]MBP7002339.1 hypothetical protein [Amaricoccus sp.]